MKDKFKASKRERLMQIKLNNITYLTFLTVKTKFGCPNYFIFWWKTVDELNRKGPIFNISRLFAIAYS